MTSRRLCLLLFFLALVARQGLQFLFLFGVLLSLSGGHGDGRIAEKSIDSGQVKGDAVAVCGKVKEGRDEVDGSSWFFFSLRYGGVVPFVIMRLAGREREGKGESKKAATGNRAPFPGSVR